MFATFAPTSPQPVKFASFLCSGDHRRPAALACVRVLPRNGGLSSIRQIEVLGHAMRGSAFGICRRIRRLVGLPFRKAAQR